MRELFWVEDDELVVRSVSRMLRRAGFLPVVAITCAAARNVDRNFDVALIDSNLPDGSGVDIAAELLAAGRVRAVVFFTGATDAELLDRAQQLGPVISKDANTLDLIDRLQRVYAELESSPTSAVRGPSEDESGAASG